MQEYAHYQIRIQGQIDEEWKRFFTGFAITKDGDGNTTLVGPVVDQAALHGTIKLIRDLGIPLLSITEETEEQR